jgi:hypothetical protein
VNPHYHLIADGHHFDNPVYTTYRPGSPLAQLEPLNNVRLVNRLKNTNSERERERLRAVATAASSCSQYLDDDDLSDCTSERGEREKGRKTCSLFLVHRLGCACFGTAFPFHPWLILPE